jgi:aldehyde:ferredoxin oxidoreductase
MAGWSGTILAIDLTESRAVREATGPYTGSFIGGRGINVKLVYDRVSPQTGTGDPDNLLVFGPGLLTGTPVPTASRMKVTSVTPNGLLTSSGIGGYVGAEIRHAGYDNIIIRGKARGLTYLLIDENGVRFKDAAHLRGKDTYETQSQVKKENGDPDLKVMCIGPAAENGVGYACIVTGIGSAAGHGGLGTVMGAKKLKAIAVRGRRGITLANQAAFLDQCLATRKWLTEDPEHKATVESCGKGVIEGSIRIGMAVFGNWEDVDWEAQDLGDHHRRADEFWDKRAVGRYGCFGCPIFDWKAFAVPGVGTGAPKCAGLVVGGTPLWNRDRDLIFEFGTACNRLGLDVSSTANVIAFLTELYGKGLISERDLDGIQLRRGNYEAVMKLVKKIACQEGFGKTVRNGVQDAAEQIGKGAGEIAMHVKGLEMQLYEMRAFKAQALAQAVASKDFIEANPLEEIREFQQAWLKHEKYEPTYQRRGPIVWHAQKQKAVTDLLGVCEFLVQGDKGFDDLAKLASLATGKVITTDDLFLAAERMLTLDRAYAVMKGIRRKDDTLPRRMFDAPLSGGLFKGEHLDRQQFAGMINEYYQLVGWDEDGIPVGETFLRLGLNEEWRTFQDRMSPTVPHA